MSSLVYIILVNYKGLEHTLECLESLDKITYDNYKTIVVDNNSNDNCCQILNKRFPNVITIQNSKNLGFAVANNIGINYALSHKADFILMLNNDTIVEKNFLNELVKEYLKHINNKVGITVGKILNYYDPNIIWYAGGNISYFKGSSNIIGLGEVDKNQYNSSDKLTFASGCCMLIGAAAIQDVGLLSDDYFLYYEDTDYSVKYIKKGYKIIYCPDSTIYHKESASTIKASNVYTYYFCRNRLLFIRNNFNIKYRIVPYTYTLLQIVKKVIIKDFGVQYTIKGIIDFLRHRTGKSEMIIN